MRNPSPWSAPVRNDAFAVPDPRGNNPHGTSEGSEHEGRRLNAGRYETVGEMDRALDVRAQILARPPRLPRPQQVAEQLGEAPAAPPTGGTWLGALMLAAIGGAVVYVLTRPDELEEVDVTPSPAPIPNPAPPNVPPALPAPITTPGVTIVMSPSSPAPSPAPVATVTTAVVDVPVKKRRRKARANTVPVPVVATVPLAKL